ncbi:MAG: SDR family NAD(P)-dependent oxidoreductase [Cyanobacteria bacterium P01_H01_bin.15]
MSSINLKGKVALVTGATRGLGKGIAIGLGEAGATVYITGRSLAPENITVDVDGTLLATQQAVEAAGGTCIPVAVDHADDQHVAELFEQIKTEQKGQLDVMVNNVYGGVRALRDTDSRPFWECEPQLWDAPNNVGLRSHYITSVYAARLMATRKQGLICTISSWGGLSYIFGAAYGAGKSGCDRLAADMAVELKKINVTSIAVWPGIVGTEHITKFVDESKDEPADNPTAVLMQDRFNWETPLLTGRAIAALASEQNSIKRTGKVQIVAEVAAKYGLYDRNGNRPASLRSLKFILPLGLPLLRKYSGLIPDIRVPWWLLLQLSLAAPRI